MRSQRGGNVNVQSIAIFPGWEGLTRIGHPHNRIAHSVASHNEGGKLGGEYPPLPRRCQSKSRGASRVALSQQPSSITATPRPPDTPAPPSSPPASRNRRARTPPAAGPLRGPRRTPPAP